MLCLGLSLILGTFFTPALGLLVLVLPTSWPGVCAGEAREFVDLSLNGGIVSIIRRGVAGDGVDADEDTDEACWRRGKACSDNLDDAIRFSSPKVELIKH